MSDATTDVLLEIAFFEPARIGATGAQAGSGVRRAHAVSSGGSIPNFWMTGWIFLTGLIVELGGRTASEVIRAGSPPAEAKVIAFDPGLTLRLGGVQVDRGRTEAHPSKASVFAVGADWPKISDC